MFRRSIRSITNFKSSFYTSSPRITANSISYLVRNNVRNNIRNFSTEPDHVLPKSINRTNTYLLYGTGLFGAMICSAYYNKDKIKMWSVQLGISSIENQITPTLCIKLINAYYDENFGSPSDVTERKFLNDFYVSHEDIIISYYCKNKLWNKGGLFDMKTIFEKSNQHVRYKIINDNFLSIATATPRHSLDHSDTTKLNFDGYEEIYFTNLLKNEILKDYNSILSVVPSLNKNSYELFLKSMTPTELNFYRDGIISLVTDHQNLYMIRYANNLDDFLNKLNLDLSDTELITNLLDILTGKIIRGENFNKFFKSLNPIKIIVKNKPKEQNGFLYQTGLNTDIYEWDPNYYRNYGGFYFTFDTTNIIKKPLRKNKSDNPFAKYYSSLDCSVNECVIREVLIPNDTPVRVSQNECKAHDIILSEEMPIPKNTKELFESIDPFDLCHVPGSKAWVDAAICSRERMNSANFHSSC